MTTWRISWKWAEKPLDCTSIGIEKGCRGGCCFSRGGTYWPASAHSPMDGPCYWLGEEGCRLALEDRPISCLMYPLVMNKNQKWVMHFRARRGCCKVNVNKGPKLVDALSRGLISLFGAERYEAIRDDVAAQRDPDVEVPDSISEEWSIEQDLRICGTVPKPRREWI